jgi:hypothetical protein
MLALSYDIPYGSYPLTDGPGGSPFLARDERIGKAADNRIVRDPGMSNADWAEVMDDFRKADLLNPGSKWEVTHAGYLLVRDKEAGLRLANSIVPEGAAQPGRVGGGPEREPRAEARPRGGGHGRDPAPRATAEAALGGDERGRATGFASRALGPPANAGPRSRPAG